MKAVYLENKRKDLSKIEVSKIRFSGEATPKKLLDYARQCAENENIIETSWFDIPMGKLPIKKFFVGFTKAIFSGSTLKILNLTCTELKGQHIKPLFTALNNCTSIEELALDHNAIKNKGGKAIAAGLKENSSLTTLRASDCKIGYKVAQSIVKVADGHENLTTLVLLMNNIKHPEKIKSTSGTLDLFIDPNAPSSNPLDAILASVGDSDDSSD